MKILNTIKEIILGAIGLLFMVYVGYTLIDCWFFSECGTRTKHFEEMSGMEDPYWSP